MAYVVSHKDEAQNNKMVQLSRPDARSTVQLVMGLKRDGVSDCTITAPDGKTIRFMDVLQIALTEDKPARVETDEAGA